MSAVATRKSKGTADMILKAIIIYDDFDAATHATALLERVALRAEESLKWDVKPWRFDVLKQPALAALTVAVAANADLIVLALSRMDTTRAELVAWLQNWAECRRIPDAAVLALRLEDTPSTFRRELKAFTERHRLVFLGKHVNEEADTTTLDDRWQRQPAAEEEDGIGGRLPLPSHWGINE